MSATRRVAITGLGIVSPLGHSPDLFFDALLAGRSGIRRLDPSFAEALTATVAAPVDLDLTAHFTRMQLSGLDRFSQFALVAARQAVADAAIDWTREDLTRCGCYLGTGMGGASTLDQSYATLYREQRDRLNPLTVINSMHNAAAAQISIEMQLQGPILTYSTACSSSGVALGEAARLIRGGYANVMLAGGVDALLTYGVIRAWEALRTLAPEDAADPAASCRPFSKDRNGLVLGEGAAVAILEDYDHAVARGAHIYGELAGYGATGDAHHITRPEQNGQVRAMRQAIQEAGLMPDAIGHINAHGTATAVGDVVETRAIKEVFGDQATQIPVSATKSMHGHLMGATAAVEFIAAVKALQQQAVPPTQFLRVPDPECDLDYVAEGARRHVPLDAVMTNSFAFGGSNAVLVIKKA